MSTKLTEATYALEMPPAPKAVALALSWRVFESGPQFNAIALSGQCNIATAPPEGGGPNLCEMTGQSKKTVERAIDWLEKSRFLTVLRTYNAKKKRRNVNEYVVCPRSFAVGIAYEPGKKNQRVTVSAPARHGVIESGHGVQESGHGDAVIKVSKDVGQKLKKVVPTASAAQTAFEPSTSKNPFSWHGASEALDSLRALGATEKRSRGIYAHMTAHGNAPDEIAAMARGFRDEGVEIDEFAYQYFVDPEENSLSDYISDEDRNTLALETRLGMEWGSEVPTIPSTAAAQAPAASNVIRLADCVKGLKGKTERMKAKLTKIRAPAELENVTAEFRQLLMVGGITPATTDKRISELTAKLGEIGAMQFMREFITNKGEKIREERKAVRTSGALAAAARWFKPARFAA